MGQLSPNNMMPPVTSWRRHNNALREHEDSSLDSRRTSQLANSCLTFIIQSTFGQGIMPHIIVIQYVTTY